MTGQPCLPSSIFFWMALTEWKMAASRRLATVNTPPTMAQRLVAKWPTDLTAAKTNHSSPKD